MLYHGSNYHIKNKLEPRLSFDYRKFVYATDDYFYALVRAGKFNTGEVLLKEDYFGKDKKFRLIEIVPGAFEKAFDVSGYIYEVDSSLFVQNNELEYVSETGVDIQNTVIVPNVWTEIKKHLDKYELIYCHEANDYWKTVCGGKDGYLERRKSRIDKLKELGV